MRAAIIVQHVESKRDIVTRRVRPQCIPCASYSPAPLARELESLGYVLEARKRWTPEFDAIRFNALNA